MSLRTLLVLIALFLPWQSSLAASITLYDDAPGTAPGQTPNQQDWLVYADDGFLFGGVANQSAIAGGVRLESDNRVRGGYSNYSPFGGLKNPAFPSLDRGQGFALEFELQLLSENHASNDRAGFSVILLADDSRGIEIGFWDDEVWPQNDTPLLTHGSGQGFDATLAEVLYRLAIIGNSFDLTANGNPLLSGPLQDYSAFGGAPYTLGNYLFLGDDTTSARATINLGLVTLSTFDPASAPSPPAWALLLCGLVLTWRRRAQTPLPAAVAAGTSTRPPLPQS